MIAWLNSNSSPLFFILSLNYSSPSITSLNLPFTSPCACESCREKVSLGILCLNCGEFASLLSLVKGICSMLGYCVLNCWVRKDHALANISKIIVQK